MLTEGEFKYKKFTYVYTILLAISCVFLAHVSSILHHGLLILLMIFGICYKSYELLRKFPIKSFFSSRVVFILWALLSITWATAYDEIINRIFVYTYSFIIVFVTYILFDHEKYIELFFRVSTVSAFLLSLYIMYHAGYNILALNRLGNDVMSINTAATKFAYIALIQFAFYLKKKKRSNLIALGYFALMIVLTGSKTAFLMAFIGSIYFFLERNALKGGIASKSKGFLIAAIFGLLIFAAITYVPALYQIFGRRIDQFIQIIFGHASYKTSYSTSVRISLVQEAWKGFLERPITGWGENNLIYFSQYSTHAHSSLMEILFDFGIVGFIAYFFQYFIICKNMKSIKIKSIYSVIGMSITIASLIEIATSISHNDLLNWLMVLFAYIYILMDKKRQCIDE